MSTSPAPRAAAHAHRSRSGTLTHLPANLAHLANERRFVCWKHRPPKYPFDRNGKPSKPRKAPYDPVTGTAARMDDPSTWGTFAECVARMQQWRGWFDGFGLALLPGDVGLDWDDCVQQGILADHVQHMIDPLAGRGYLEISVSGKGVHAIVLGSLPASLKTDAIEMYPGGSGRFFTISGNELPGSAAPHVAQDVLDQLYSQHAPVTKQAITGSPFPLSLSVALTPELSADIQAAKAQIANLLQRLQRGGMTPQLKDLIEHGQFPPAMKDTTDSGARAVIVYQLDRSPAQFSDGEIFALAEHLIEQHGFTGKIHNLRRDVDRLLTRSRAGRQGISTTTAPKPARQPMLDRITYMRRLTAESLINDTILLNQAQRATAAGVPLGTAKKLDAEIVNAGWVERFTYALRGEGVKGRSGGLRLTDAGRAVLYPVIFSQNSPISEPAQAVDPVKEPAPAAEKSPEAKLNNTVLCDIPQPDEAAPRATTHHNNPCSLPPKGAALPVKVSRADMLSIAVRRYGDNWKSALAMARREYPEFFASKADYGKFKGDYERELGARIEALDNPDARVAVESGDARALRATGQHLLFDLTGVHDYAAQWDRPEQSPIVPLPTAEGGGGERSVSGVAAASAAGPAHRPQVNPEKIRFVLDQLPKRGALWARGYLDRVEGPDKWPAHIRCAIAEQATREGVTV